MHKLILLSALFLLNIKADAQKLAKKKDVEVSIELENGTLMGSMLLPKSKKPLPVVLLIPGSGPTDRNCNSGLGLKSNSFIYIAEALYKKGIATLRVDKRVSGKSAKTFHGKDLLFVQFSDFILDAERWIDTLQNDPRFSSVIVAGHSQGSLVGMVAAKNKSADKFISISGAGRSIDKILNDQLAAGIPKHKDTIPQFLDSIKMGSYMKSAPLILKQSLPEYLAPFMKEWMEYNPTQIIAEMNMPSLIINGENDVQVDAEEARILYAKAKNAQLEIIPKMNHILKDAPKERLSNLATYNLPLLPVNETLIELIITFCE